ncbi:hypothetical protein [Paenibacillus eucommiae]|uniref:Lipoprotein n=1 Tax=Paenibacillus eucommiae TaxID=1355755 RepID=A0ABS4J1K3_9BACL|nr:hypothetical protein [Paenibacillus eucommiae]MBP1993709.1 hypothetical protein [Paenibacillus eucommiae]
MKKITLLIFVVSILTACSTAGEGISPSSTNQNTYTPIKSPSHSPNNNKSVHEPVVTKTIQSEEQLREELREKHKHQGELDLDHLKIIGGGRQVNHPFKRYRLHQEANIVVPIPISKNSIYMCVHYTSKSKLLT